MSLTSLLKSMLSRFEPLSEVTEVQAEQEAAAETPSIPALDRGMPIEVMKDFDTVLLCGRQCALNGLELTIERIPGAMSFPILETGSEVLVRGYDYKVDPVILRAVVLRSSVIECVLGELETDPYYNHRKSTRYPLTPLGNIYTMEDRSLSNPQACKLLNISIGGACIMSEHLYDMGQALRLRVELVKNGGHTSYQCQVVRVIPQKDGSFEYGLLFAQLDSRKIRALMLDIETIQNDTKKKLLS